MDVHTNTGVRSVFDRNSEEQYGVNPQEDKTVDSVISLLPEPFDKVVEAAKLFFEFIDYYTVSDPLGQAVQLIQQEIQKIEQDLQYVNTRLNELATKIAQVDNTNRWRTLESYNRQLYAVQPDGTLLWYKHEAWETGFPDEEIVGVGLQTHLQQHDPWQGPITAGSGWTGYRNLFALLPAASEQPH